MMILIKKQVLATLVLIYIIAFLWWLYITATGAQNQLVNNLYGLILGFIPLIGGLYGLYLSRSWGSFRSAIGKSLIFLSLGLICWSVGTYIFAGYYNLYARIEVPYPSWSDLAYILSWPLWTIGIYYLSKAMGARYGVRDFSGKLILLIVPILIVVASYYLLIIIARGGGFDFTDSNPLKIFFDLFYPIGDVVILTFIATAYSLSYKYFGGKFKVPIYIIFFGFVINYFADFFFSYTTTKETFYSGGWVDFVFTTAMFVLSLGVALLDQTVMKIGPDVQD